jgi:preprotein translocase subunit SecD
MAGILAAIGVGVDAQIVITDEILKKDENTIEEKTEPAFSIIKMNAIVASLSMLPLFFSGIVEIIGFAISTILGSLLGYLLSRPAYAVIVEKILGIEEKQ